MHIFILFHFNNEESPVAVTGVEGEVTDLTMPNVGDVVRHRDVENHLFQGKVTDRVFEYNIRNGITVDGAVLVSLCLDRTIVH